MPTGLQLCYVDAYAQHTAARILDPGGVDGSGVPLDRTVFYPGGGGQPKGRTNKRIRIELTAG